jgi:hypothetical protein
MNNMKQIFVVCRYTSDGVYCIEAKGSRVFADANRALDYADRLNRTDPVNSYRLAILDFDQQSSQSRFRTCQAYD